MSLRGRIQPIRTLEIGAGTGTNSIWLAEIGFDVLGVDGDLDPLAVERATANMKGRDHSRRALISASALLDGCGSVLVDMATGISRRSVN